MRNFYSLTYQNVTNIQSNLYKEDSIQIEQQHYLIIDLEATCCDDNSFPRHEMEIIEIGAVMLHAPSLEVVSEFQSFIKPVRHAQLTPFCIELTSIKQSDVDAAPEFPEVLNNMINWAANFDDWLFCSWGDYDAKQFVTDCTYHHVAYPFGYPVEQTHLNLKAAFSTAIGQRRRFGMRGAMSKLGLELQGTHHRGIDDARNIAQIVRTVLAHTEPR